MRAFESQIIFVVNMQILSYAPDNFARTNGFHILQNAQNIIMVSFGKRFRDSKDQTSCASMSLREGRTTDNTFVLVSVENKSERSDNPALFA